MKSDVLPEALMQEPGQIVEIKMLPGETITAACKRLGIVGGTHMGRMSASNLKQVQNLIQRREFLQRQADICAEPYTSWTATHSKHNAQPVDLPKAMMEKYLKGLLEENTSALEALGVDPWS